MLAYESRIPWEAALFTRLRVESTVAQDAHTPRHPIGYELIPHATGRGRYSGTGEAFTQNELWVTRENASQLRPRDLANYENGEPLGTGPVTLWHSSAVLHVARDEDFGINGTNSGDGVAITAWAGFDLKPRNLFANTPLYP